MMRSTDQQAAAPADAEVPAEHEVPDDLPLAAGFPAATREAWRELVAGVLRKAGREDLPDPVEDALRVPVATGGWDVRQRHAHPDVALTKEAIAADLENGVTSLWLQLGEGAVPVGALGDVLADVYLDLAPVSVSGIGAGGGVRAAEALLAHVADRTDLAPGGSLGLDPLGVQAASGEEQDLTGLADVARRAPAGWRTVVVDATVFHDAGASAVEELGCSLAAGAAYLRALTDGGLSTDEAFAALEFRYAASADQFTTIAALRAARRLWDRVGEVSGASPDARAQRQHAVTSSVMTTRRDPWVNMLRTTVACFAAGVGGADVVTVQPFDAALGLPDAFSRRIARNTQALLVEEAHLARVLDPAGGSGVRGAARPRRRRPADGARAEGLPGHHRADRPAHRPCHLRRQPVPGRGSGDAVGRRGHRPRRRGDDGRLHLRDRSGLRGVRGGTRPGAARRRGHRGVAGRQAVARRRGRRRVRVRRVRRARRPAASPRAAGSPRMSTIPDFGGVELGRPAAAASVDDWAKAFKEATGRGVEEAAWETPEGIAVPPLF